MGSARRAMLGPLLLSTVAVFTAVGPFLADWNASWVSQAIAFTFPGVGWTDPDLLPPGKTMSSLPIQIPLLVGAGAILALRSRVADRAMRA